MPLYHLETRSVSEDEAAIDSILADAWWNEESKNALMPLYHLETRSVSEDEAAIDSILADAWWNEESQTLDACLLM